MYLARFLNKLIKDDGFILVDANSVKYIIGNPKKEKPIILRLLDKKLHYKLLFYPDLYFGEAYANGDIKIWQYFVRISGCGVVFFLVKFFADNWENMTWESEDDDSDDDE